MTIQRTDHAVYVLHAEPSGVVWINAEDLEYPVAKFALEPGANLHEALTKEGWRIVGAGLLPRGLLYVARR